MNANTAKLGSFIGYTIGLSGRIKGHNTGPKLVKAEFHHTADGTGDVHARLVSGHNLGAYPSQCRIPSEEWEDSPDSGSVEEAQWALRKLGVEV